MEEGRRAGVPNNGDSKEGAGCGTSGHIDHHGQPGINTQQKKGQWKEAEELKVQIAIVESQRYMKTPHSIMLTVARVNVDIASQEIIGVAREGDPDGERTVRVLKRPDLSTRVPSTRP